MISWAQDHGLQSLLNPSINWFGLYTWKVCLAPRFAKLLYCVCKVGFLLPFKACSHKCFLPFRKRCL